MRADGEAAALAQRFLELGLDPDKLVLVVRVLAEGLSRTAEVMRFTALSAIMHPGATELEIAKASKALVLPAIQSTSTNSTMGEKTGRMDGMTISRIAALVSRSTARA